MILLLGFSAELGAGVQEVAGQGKVEGVLSVRRKQSGGTEI